MTTTNIELFETGLDGAEVSRRYKNAVRSMQKNEVTAAFCETDRVAAMVHQACVREGIRVPEDLAVVGYDNIDLARWLNLTTVEQHFEEIGRKAVKLLLDDIEGNLAEPVHLEVTSELIIRGSTRREMA